jgi:UDP-2,4-diacetamido-2,4,6-trideoxy-beta-L-altropyranose hydrolase
MRVLFRSDSSLQLGAGHAMRCMTLAHALEQQGVQTRFLCRAHPGHLGRVLEHNNVDLLLLPATLETDLGADEEQDAVETRTAASDWGADWIIVDHYCASGAWEAAQALPVMAIDDAPNRDHNAVLLLDQNLDAKASNYRPRLPHGATILTGPQYALLRPEFAKLRPESLEHRVQSAGQVQRLLISMGGTDMPDATGWVLGALATQIDSDVLAALDITVVMGPTAPHLESVRQRATALPGRVTVLAGTDRMADLMVSADLAIGGAGSSAWERCVLGLPAILVVLADNQKVIAKALSDCGANGHVDLHDTDALIAMFKSLCDTPQTVLQMSQISAGICDGHGAQKVAGALLEQSTVYGAPR